MIVDSQVEELPADPPGIALAGPVACDAMPGSRETAELLDVDVDQLAGVCAFVAPHRLSRLQRRDAIEAEPTQHTVDGGGRHPEIARSAGR